MTDRQDSPDATSATEPTEAGEKTGEKRGADRQSDLRSVEDYWYRSLTTRGVDSDAAERIIRAAQSHPVLVSGDPSREEIDAHTREGISMVNLADEGIEQPERVREEMREVLDHGLDGKIPGPMSLTTPYDVQVASATGPSGESIAPEIEIKGKSISADSEGVSDQTSTEADGEEASPRGADFTEDRYEALITRALRGQGETELKAAEELGYEVANSAEAQEQIALDDNIVAEFIERIEKYNNVAQSEAARALGVLVIFRETNTKEHTAQKLLNRVEQNPTQQHYTQALAEMLSFTDEPELHQTQEQPEPANNTDTTEQVAVRGSENNVDKETAEQPDELPEAVKIAKSKFVDLIQSGEMTPEEFNQMYHEVLQEISASELE